MHSAYSLAILNIELKCYEDAILEPCWREAIRAELDALNENKTWTLTSLPSDKKAIGCKWSFKIKYHPDGTLRVVLALAAVKGWHLKQIDVNTAFLRGELDEKVYMKPPRRSCNSSGSDLLRDTGFEHCKPASTPMDYGAKLSKDDGDSLPDSSDYRKTI
ncbi:uncharacterized mitochondrial protein AtMg00820-like [Arachis stenosperma]|uniref:uncharacterized mitochondrial protein AtMg00820-like n=1 Tax=Arachis stenosperma TaxID=217475 RepID=UPI0025AC074C|nr:uncharacterized mitochondrial protein AtMg00820-like [Arachis stenosperma]